MNRDKRRILHIIDNLGLGGAEILLANTVKDLPDYEHVVILLSGPEDLKKDLPSGVTYYKLNFDLNKRILFKILQLKSINKLKRIITKEKPDVIHAHLFWSTFFSRLVRSKQSCFFFTVHSMIGERVFKESFLYRWLEKLTVSSTQHLIAISESVKNNYLTYIPFKGASSIIYNYIADQFFQKKKQHYNIKGNVFRIVSVGNLKPVKNYEVQIRAMALLGNKFQLHIYGTGEPEAIRLKKLMEELNISNVELKGGVSNLYQVLPVYDLFVMSSFSEGYSIARAEAMACALPVLLSDIPSFRESTDGEALFFDPQNFHELAQKVIDLSESQNLRQRLGEKSYEVALKYGKRENYLKSLRALYG